MNKVVSSFAALLLTLLCAGAALAAAGTPTVLLLPFTINAGGGVQATFEKDVPALLQSSLNKQGIRALSVAEGARLMKKANVDTITPETAAKLAREAKVSHVMYGSLSQLGEAISLDIRLVDAMSGEVRPLYAERANSLELMNAVDEITSKAFVVAPMIGVTTAPATSARPQGTAPYSKDSITDIQVRGLRLLDPDVVLVRLNTRKGDVPTAEALNTDMTKVWDLGYFSDVTVDVEPGPSGKVLVFHVVEKPRIDDVQVEGSDEVSIGDITEAMSSRTGTVLNDKVLAQDLQKITELYRKEGFYLADVSYTLLPKPDNASAVLVLKVNEGKKLYIKEVRIEGLDKIDRSELEDYLALTPRGMFSWLTGSGVLKEEFLERDSQAIMALAVNRGYINAQVSAPDVSYDDSGITVTYRVREGDRYALGEVGFRGDLIDTEERLLGLIALDDEKVKNTYFSLDVMQEDIKKLTEFYNDYGYAFASVGVENVVHPDEPVVDIYFTLEPREKVYVRRVELEGNYRTRDNVILRELRVADGQEFSGEKLRRTSERLNKLSYFKTVDTQLVPTGTPGEVDLKIKVEEDNTGMLSAGIGYSTYDKVGVMANISEANLFGRGYMLNLQGYISAKEASMNLGFVNPRINDTNLGFGTNVYAIEQEWTEFDKRTIGSTISFSYPLGEYTGVHWGYRLDFYTLSNIKPYAAESIKAYEGDNWASVVNVGIGRDTTDSRTMPTKGTKTSFNLYYGGGGLGGDDNFIKGELEYGFFYSLTPSQVFHARGIAGGVFKNTDNTIPAFERFYIGGINSIRGYSLEDISPRDPRTGESIGSDRMAHASLEYIWMFEKQLGLAIVPFFDIGVSVDSDQSSDLFSKPFYSTGLELRWRSPMGDLRFAYGIPLAKNVDGESRRNGRFEFTMGQAF